MRRVSPAEYLRLDLYATVHGWISIALATTATGYRLYFAAYVLPVSWLTRPYLIAIEPFRRFLVYPAMLGRIRRAWIAAYARIPTPSPAQPRSPTRRNHLRQPPV